MGRATASSRAGKPELFPSRTSACKTRSSIPVSPVLAPGASYQGRQGSRLRRAPAGSGLDRPGLPENERGQRILTAFPLLRPPRHAPGRTTHIRRRPMSSMGRFCAALLVSFSPPLTNRQPSNQAHKTISRYRQLAFDGQLRWLSLRLQAYRPG